ncbi:hypothetical protein M5689_013458 [Euphorbia peplus]|nr:hypothetical protein M5689_013458 [Euphorbia peplus]
MSQTFQRSDAIYFQLRREDALQLSEMTMRVQHLGGWILRHVQHLRGFILLEHFVEVKTVFQQLGILMMLCHLRLRRLSICLQFYREIMVSTQHQKGYICPWHLKLKECILKTP